MQIHSNSAAIIMTGDCFIREYSLVHTVERRLSDSPLSIPSIIQNDVQKLLNK